MLDIKERLRLRADFDLPALLMLAFAFFLPLSISLAEFFAYLAVLSWLVELRRHPGDKWLNHPLWAPAVLFGVLLIISATLGPNPEYSVPKCRRMLLLPLLPMIPMIFRANAQHPRRTLLEPLLFFLAGATVLGLFDLLRVPYQVWQGVGLYDAGNMRDPQLYMVALFVLLALWMYRSVVLSPAVMGLLLVINMAGMVLHFKRGVWISFVVTLTLMAGLTRRYRLLGGVIVGFLLLMLVPQAQDRMALLQEEFQVKTGGRWVLWTQVAPKMIADHPMGVGMRGLDHNDFLNYSHNLQPGLNHLHNNLLQVAVDTGWVGALVWIYWMGLMFAMIAFQARKYHTGDPERATVALSCMAGFTGIMLNGMVEYNFGNSVIFMLILLLMGLTSALYQSDRAARV